jgi:parallel beta-helix repeat protein
MRAFVLTRNLFMVLVALFIGGLGASTTMHAAIIYVDHEGLCDGNVPCYTTINAGINEAGTGDTVYVYNGTYYENVVVNTTIDLIGEDMNNTVIDAGGSGNVINLSADEVTISGFTIQHGEDYYHQAGISASSDGNNINGNVIEYNHLGIFMEGSSYNQIVGNSIKHNYETGIYLLDQSSNNSITGNTISHNNHDGIIMQFDCDSNRIEENTISNNDDDGIFLSSSSTVCISQNFIQYNGRHGIFLSGSYNGMVEGNTLADNFPGYGINLEYSDGNVIRSNDLVDDYRGIVSYSSDNNTIDRNTIRGGIRLQNGVELTESSHDTISSNTIENVHGHGIELSYRCHDNLIRGNTIRNSRYDGIQLNSYSYTDNNVIYHNNLIDNSRNACDGGMDNVWDHGYPGGGNYWSNYTGSDDFSGPDQNIPGSDGIGDTPHPVPCGTSQDQYPLIRPLICGDSNLDGIIDVGDVVFLINYLFRGGDPPLPMAVGDVNCNDTVDVGDVVFLINYLYVGGPPPCGG